MSVTLCTTLLMVLFTCLFAEKNTHVTRGLTEILSRDTPPPVLHTHRLLVSKPKAIMVPGRKAIYTLDKGVKHLIPDWDSFCSLGYDLSHIVYVSAAEMDAFETGPDVAAIQEEGVRDDSAPCPCHSKSRHPYELQHNEEVEANNNNTTPPQRARNICILKNIAMDKLFTEVYELNELQKHLHFFLVDEDHMVREETARWKLYNETVREYSTKGEFSKKYTGYSSLKDFTEAEASPDIGASASSGEASLEFKKQSKEELKAIEDTRIKAEKEATDKAVDEERIKRGWNSDTDAYPSPYFNNGHGQAASAVAAGATRRRLRRHPFTPIEHTKQQKGGQVHSANITPSQLRSIPSTISQWRHLEEDAAGNTACDVVIEIMSDDYNFQAHVCPGVCQPHPRVHVIADLLLPEPLHPANDLTCSLSLEYIFRVGGDVHSTKVGTPAGAGTGNKEKAPVATGDESVTEAIADEFGRRQMRGDKAKGKDKSSSSGSNAAALLDNHNNSEEPNPKNVAHARLAMILHAVARRKIEECSEKEYWWPAVRHRLPSHTIAALQEHAEQAQAQAHSTATDKSSKEIAGNLMKYIADPPRKKVRGLIIWIGSISRFSIARAQIEVLQSQVGLPAEEKIIGWLATEEIYGCKIGTTTCTSLSPRLAYYPYMPTSKLNISPAGYNCAQRRPLRSIAHVLHLYDPQEFLFVVDDDTWVNINKLAMQSTLSNYIRTNMNDMNNPLVLGQLTAGKKITRHGFFYGGAGYLMGKAVVEKLAGNTIAAPININGDGVRDELTMKFLQIMMQTITNSKITCPDCVLNEVRSSYNNTFEYDWETWGAKQYITLKEGARLIDVCMNLMSEEHTCYASDHAMSRCLIHGVYATPINLDCGDPNPLHLGMCMGIDNCIPESLLTCHRWMADPLDYRNPIVATWTEDEE